MKRQKKRQTKPSNSVAEKKIRKIILKTGLSPGDLVMLTAAIRDLKAAHSNILVDVRTAVPDLWDNNIFITRLDDNDKDAEHIDVEYPAINNSNSKPFHFIHGYRMFLEDRLGIKIPQGDFRGYVPLSEQEKSWMNQIQEMGVEEKFWLLFSGGKWDYTAKWWNPEEYQKVVDHFKDKILFVQCGELSHHHPQLQNVINLVGKTNTRQLVRLMYHAVGVVCPVTFAMHLARAVDTPRKHAVNRPCVVLAGGREPTHWESYPTHKYLHHVGALDCCDIGGCWRSRAFELGEGDEKDKSLCLQPVDMGEKITTPQGDLVDLKIPKCLDMITHKHVIEAIESYYDGGVIEYGKGWGGVNIEQPNEIVVEPEDQGPKTLSEF